MNPWQEFHKGHATGSEPRLLLEDRDLYLRILTASPRQRSAVSLAVARWAVRVVHLTETVFDRVLAELAQGKAVSPALASNVEGGASYLDGAYRRLKQQRDEGREVSEDELLSVFSLPRAASCVYFALSGEPEEATYEAIAATVDLPEVHAVVLSALFSTPMTSKSLHTKRRPAPPLRTPWAIGVLIRCQHPVPAALAEVRRWEG